MKLTIKQKEIINDLKQFYIDHMIEMYNNDWDLFWEENEDIIQIESELELNED
jgi:hypothetical protein